jgi:hypothetical protein
VAPHGASSVRGCAFEGTDNEGLCVVGCRRWRPARFAMCLRTSGLRMMADLRSGAAPWHTARRSCSTRAPARAGVRGQRRRVRGEVRQGSVSRYDRRQERGQGHGKEIGASREASSEGPRRRGKADEAGVRSTRCGCPADGPYQGTQARNRRTVGGGARLVPCRVPGAIEGACEAVRPKAGRCPVGRSEADGGGRDERNEVDRSGVDDIDVDQAEDRVFARHANCAPAQNGSSGRIGRRHWPVLKPPVPRIGPGGRSPLGRPSISARIRFICSLRRSPATAWNRSSTSRYSSASVMPSTTASRSAQPAAASSSRQSSTRLARRPARRSMSFHTKKRRT